jgi:hypothetical protein
LHDVSRAVPSLPISRRPNPSLFGRVFVPMPRHPDGIHARALFPMAGCPEPMVIAIIPVSRHPDVGLARSGSFHLRPQRWRLLPHHHRSRRRCRDGFRGHDHGLMIMRSAPAQYRCAHHHQRQNAKRNYFLHKFFPLGWRGQPWFFAIPANGLRNISSMAGKGRWGTLLLRSGGIFPKVPGVPPSSDRGFTLELFERGVIFLSCQSTSFIAKSAGKTAKSSPAPAIGKTPSAPNAVPRRSRRNFPFSLPPMPGAKVPRRAKAAVEAAAAAVAAESRTGNEGRSVK